MSKKRNRVHFELNADGVKSLTDQDSGNGIVLEGKCKKCGHKVARFIES